MRTYSPLAVAVNLLLGLPAVVPLFLIWYFLANWPLAELGWTDREPTENDGVLPWVLFAGPVLVGFAALWWLANLPVRRRSAGTGARLYWPVSMLLTLVPMGVLAVL
ncbi:hypothetical protein ACFCX4_00790 [Kitasatospora sp. NPDC056327]|uniref:hypothetical protein n=1 Tax=Kitasatospora sp. NPDC056327 TaxID=3345785 RepID=UPI0035DD10F3